MMNQQCKASARGESGHWIISAEKRVNADTGEVVRYPIFTFANLEKKKAPEKSIREKGIEYIENKFKKRKAA